MGQCASQSNLTKSKDAKAQIYNQFEVNDFKFIKLIGKGGFGKVWKVQNKKSGKFSAIKVMEKSKMLANKCIKSAIEERKILTELSKVGIGFIVKIQCSFQDSTKLYLLMDYIEGKTLRSHLNYGNTLTQLQIKLLVLSLVRILSYLHQHQIIHKDVKPQNILIDKEGVPFLTDFGSASYLSEDNYENSGTLGYMAPQVMQCQTHNFAADYYAIGIITFQLFFKKRPYNHQTKQELLKLIRQKPVNLQNFPQLNTINTDAQDFIVNLLKRKQYDRLGYNEGIIQLLSHPWFNSKLNQINITNQIGKIKNGFQFEDYPQGKFDDILQQSEQTQQIQIAKYGNILQRDHVQDMFKEFNSFQTIQNQKKQKNLRKNSCQTLSKLQTAYSLKKYLKD